VFDIANLLMSRASLYKHAKQLDVEYAKVDRWISFGTDDRFAI